MSLLNRPLLLRPGTAAGILLAVVLLGIAGSLRVSLLEDIGAMLPDRDERLLQEARKWGLMEKVMVVIGPAEAGSPRLHRAVEEVTAALGKLNGIAGVHTHPAPEEISRSATLLAERGARLYTPESNPIDPEEMRARLLALKARLASPEAMVTGEILLADPLGFARDAFKALESIGEGMGTISEQGHLLSRDRRFALVIADIAFDPMQVTRAAGFTRELDRVLQETVRRQGIPGLKATALGGVTYAASTATAMSGDLRWTFGLTLLLIIAIFWLFFRRMRLLPVAVLPGGAGIAAGMGAMGALNMEVHALTLGFAATITGISIDYVIHLLHRARTDPRAATDERMTHALAEVSRPVILGCVTTVGSFAIVATSGFTGIRQLALFAMISLPVALLATLLIVPAFHRFLLGDALQRAEANTARWQATLGMKGRRGHRRLVLILFIVWAAGATTVATTVRFSGDPRDMGHHSADLANREAALKQRFPGLLSHVLLVASGSREQEALESNDALYRRLLTEGWRRENILSVSPILPSLKTQERSVASATRVVSGHSPCAADIFAAAGFTPAFFEQFRHALAPLPLTPATFQGTSLDELTGEAIVRHGDTVHVLTRVRIEKEDEVTALARIADAVAGCRLVSERLEAKIALDTMQTELKQMLAIWLLIVLVLLAVTERSCFFGLRAALPSILGVLSAVALFALLNRPLTPVASAGILLVMGLGIDYGIFMQSGEATTRSRTALAVLASALTTIAAFGVLAVSDIRALQDMGLIILVGVTVSLVTALYLIPELAPEAGREP